METLSIKTPSISDILKKISDDKALVLFNSIAISPPKNDRYIPLRELNLSTKQYYSRISGLTAAGLIKRRKGRYSLTMLGKVVYESHMLIGRSLAYFWKLKAIESIEMSSDDRLSEGELPQLINALINDPQIKDILVNSISNLSIESCSQKQTTTSLVEQI